QAGTVRMLRKIGTVGPRRLRGPAVCPRPWSSDRMIGISSLTALVIVGFAWATAVAAAQSPDGGPPWQPKNPAAARKLALQNQADQLINEAQQHVDATMPGCKPSLPHEHGKPT